MKTRYDEMLEVTNKFHTEHPEVWDWFCEFTFDRIKKGYKNYGAKGVFERIRWETTLGEDGKVMFKIGNNHTPFYARGFMLQYPQHAGFFRLREQKTHHMPTRGKELTPDDYKYIN